MTQREKVVNVAKSYLGAYKGDARHKEILRVYNAQNPLPVGYKVQINDSWCATFVTFVFIKAGLKQLVPAECSCPRMITVAKAMGIWQENDAHVPKLGDIVLYDWQDSGIGDNRGNPDHVGIVTGVQDNTITVIEGNKGNKVAYRQLQVNGRYIRGYVLPKFEEETDLKPKHPEGKEVDEVVTKGKFIVNGKATELDRIIKDNRQYIKLDDLKKLGLKVEWEQSTKTTKINF